MSCRNALKKIFQTESGDWFINLYKDKKIFLSLREVKTLCPILEKLADSSIERVDKVTPAPAKRFATITYAYIKHLRFLGKIFKQKLL